MSKERTGFVDAATGEDMDMGVVEQAGVAFDPTSQHLDLSKEEKRRTTALMLAIQGYRELIIKDADYLREVYTQNRQTNGPPVRPATIDAMVETAIKFDMFIAGDFEAAKKVGLSGGHMTEAGPISDKPATTE